MDIIAIKAYDSTKLCPIPAAFYLWHGLIGDAGDEMAAIRSRGSAKERRRIRLKPLALFLMVGKFADRDTVDRRRGINDTLDLVAGHFPNPQHPRSLQTGVCEVDRPVWERLVEIAAPDQSESDTDVVA